MKGIPCELSHSENVKAVTFYFVLLIFLYDVKFVL